MKNQAVVLILLTVIFYGCSKSGDGTDGKTSLIDFLNEPAGANCSSGGFRVVTGMDENGNGTLDAGEVQNTKYLCNGGAGGANGLNSLIAFVSEPAGQNCSNGGYRVNAGLDVNSNGTLETAEVKSTQYICNGTPGGNGSQGPTGPTGPTGPNGAAGLNNLVSVVNEAAGANCPNGGKKINYGLDLNRNNILDASEISTSSYVCNANGGGTDGYNSLVSVSIEPIGTNCAGGGNRINYGLDLNRNNVLEASEFTSTTYMCNANRVYAAVVSQTGTGAPSSVPLINNLDVAITWSRTGVGRYVGTISKSMVVAKTIVLSNNTGVTTTLTSPTRIQLDNRCAVNTFCDGFTNVTVGLLVVD